MRGNDDQVGAVLETRSALEYKDKVTVFKRMSYMRIVQRSTESAFARTRKHNLSHLRGKDIVMYIFCKVNMSFVKSKKITWPVVVIHCGICAVIPNIWVI